MAPATMRKPAEERVAHGIGRARRPAISPMLGSVPLTGQTPLPFGIGLIHHRCH